MHNPVLAHSFCHMEPSGNDNLFSSWHRAAIIKHVTTDSCLGTDDFCSPCSVDIESGGCGSPVTCRLDDAERDLNN